MDFKHIAQKRQKRRKEAGIYQVTEDDSKEKFYVLDMFPYPSGAGLHVGHPKGYIASDVVARKKMLEGYNVLHPMGFDTFGLGAENYAIKHKTTPQKATNQNIQTFISQLEKFGCTYDRDRMISTADPKYYKWTQRIFLQLYHHYYDDGKNTARPISALREDIQAGRVDIPSDLSLEEFLDTKRLAYVDEKPINRCPACKTGLANEDLEGGKCERCGSEIEQRPMKQRVLRITKYADRLVDDLELLEKWEHQHKEMQRNRIGRSTGTEIKMDVADQDNKEIAMFTTRIDTVFGATFVVLAPEHPLVDEITTSSQRQKVQAYQDQARHKTQLERTELAKEKTGVFTGGYAVNPFNQERLPIRIADYVMMGYGTGAVMAVPAHDERDFAFAKKYDLPIRQVVVPYFMDTGKDKVRPDKPTITRKTVYGIITNKDRTKFLLLDRKKFGWKSFIIGGVEDGEDPQKAVVREVQEETGYKNAKLICQIGGEVHSNFFARHKDVNRYAKATTYLIEIDEKEKSFQSKSEQEKHETVRIAKENVATFLTLPAHLYLRENFLNNNQHTFTDKGILVNSPETTYTEGEKKIQKYLNKKMRDAPLEEPKSGIHNDTSANLSLEKKHTQNSGEINTKTNYNGHTSQEAIPQMQQRLQQQKKGGPKKQYKIQDRVFSRQRYRGEPFPIIWTEEKEKK